MATQNYTLGYWPIRGLCEPIKLLLAYLEVPYELKEYSSEQEWHQKKFDKSIKFANLPYLIDGEKTVTESEAILAYVCVKAGKPEMVGKIEDRAEFLQLKGVFTDVLSKVGGGVYASKSQDELKEKVEKYMATAGSLKLGELEEILGKREWFLGYLTYLDFVAAEFIERYNDLDKEVGTKIFANYPNIQALGKRVLELPAVKAYRQSERFRARPHHLAGAIWS